MIRSTFTALAVAVALAAYMPASAQNYPVKMVRLIVPFPPGGSTELGAKALPDGYTLLMGSGGPLTINPSLYAKLPERQRQYNLTNERADAE